MHLFTFPPLIPQGFLLLKFENRVEELKIIDLFLKKTVRYWSFKNILFLILSLVLKNNSNTNSEKFTGGHNG